MLAYMCTPSYLRGGDLEHYHLRPAQAKKKKKVKQDPVCLINKPGVVVYDYNPINAAGLDRSIVV
jgi:hypothetical protein